MMKLAVKKRKKAEKEGGKGDTGHVDVAFEGHAISPTQLDNLLPSGRAYARAHTSPDPRVPR